MSTLEAVRTLLCQPHEASASEIMKAARDELGRLEQATRTAKNIQQRNGAKKKLADLQPMMAALEVEANLTAFEEAINRGDGKGAPAQRAAVRVQGQKLGGQIAALPNNDEKEVFQGWFTDLNASLTAAAAPVAPPPPPIAPKAPEPTPVPAPEVKPTATPSVPVAPEKPEPAPEPPPALPPAVEETRKPSPPPPTSESNAGKTTRVTEPLPPPADPTPAPPKPVVRPPPLPPVDPSLALNSAVASLDIKAKVRPLLDAPSLLRDLETITAKVAVLPPSEKKSALERKVTSLISAIKTQEDLRQLTQTVDTLERSSKQPTADFTALSSELDRLTAQSSPLLDLPESAPIKQRLGTVKATLATQRELSTLNTALQALDIRIEHAPTVAEVAPELEALADRISRVNDLPARTSLSARLDPLKKRIAQRREEEKITAAVTAARRLLDAPDATPQMVKPAFDIVTRQVQALPPGPVRTDLEKQLAAWAEPLASLEAKFAPKAPQKAVMLRLEPVKGRSAPNARPLVFVARDRFSIGRLPEKEPPRADFLTPSAETRISRIHVSFLLRQGKIHILAGEEGKPSTNPAHLDDVPLTATPTATAFDTERRIDLTGVLHLRAKSIPSSTPFGPPLDEEMSAVGGGATVVMPAISGSLRIRPQGEDMLPTIAIWIFTDATIGAAPTCAVSLPQAKMAPEQARIHYWQKSFWIEALRATPPVELAGKPVTTGASQPLRSDQELKLGDSCYTVRLTEPAG